MTKKTKQVSVFAIVSCLVFVLTAIEAAPLLSGRIKFLMSYEGVVHNLNIPHIEIILTIFFSVMALRLYLHAWAIDESPVYEEIKKDASNRRNYILTMEWVFRVSWVLMVTYLPSIFANEEITILKVEIRWELYFVVIFLFILLWDVIMIDKIIKHSKFVARNKDREEESISELKKIWRKYDIFLFLSAAFVYINGALPWAKYGDYINYKLPIFFVLISTMFGICIVQLSRWSREIYLSLKTIEVGSSP